MHPLRPPLPAAAGARPASGYRRSLSRLGSPPELAQARACPPAGARPTSSLPSPKLARPYPAPPELAGTAPELVCPVPAQPRACRTHARLKEHFPNKCILVFVNNIW
jgi:hypothetical protein